MAIKSPYQKIFIKDIINAKKTKLKTVGNANVHFYPGYRWKKTASELTYWFIQYNKSQNLEKIWASSNEYPGSKASTQKIRARPCTSYSGEVNYIIQIRNLSALKGIYHGSADR